MTDQSKRTRRTLRAKLRAARKLMQELSEIAGDDVERLGEIIELDGEWIRWIKEDIEPRFHS